MNIPQILYAYRWNPRRAMNKFFFPRHRRALRAQLFLNGVEHAHAIREKHGRQYMMTGAIPKKNDKIVVFYEYDDGREDIFS